MRFTDANECTFRMKFHEFLGYVGGTKALNIHRRSPIERGTWNDTMSLFLWQNLVSKAMSQGTFNNSKAHQIDMKPISGTAMDASSKPPCIQPRGI